ncbi:hypothetical protein G5C51_04620 [Streptomyces sp. A7024]|uniref:Uncharacterized protein n=1 Tax=Streptomyces coryli TaxID=1128680 RepID=A0A6G4TTT7_9ACTN|nr:hypothetical protein [Streptomyces coryli]NGN63192.1 hypothetical protein [Streptomyces coryli]
MREPEQLDADQRRINEGWTQAIRLGVALVSRPLDEATYDELRSFIAVEADAVVASLNALRDRDEPALRAQIADLERHGAWTGGTA